MSAPIPESQRLQEICALIDANRFEAASAVLKRLLAESPGCVPGWLILAKMAQHLNKLDAAVKAAGFALELAPQSADAHYTLGRVHKARGEVDFAIDCYRRAVDLDPRNATVLTSLGLALRQRGRVHEAISAYRTALAIAPDLAEARLNLANALESVGECEEARRHRTMSGAAFSSQFAAALEQAQGMIARGETLNATFALREALRIAPGNSELWLLLGTAAFERRDFETSLSALEEAIRLDPKNLPALNFARRVSASLGDSERARHFSQQVLSLDSSHLARITLELSVPAIADSAAAIDATRTQYAQGIEGLLAARLRVDDVERTNPETIFYLAYHGKCDRDLLCTTAKFYERAAPSLSFAAPHCRGGERSPGRTRVGFISKFLHDHSIGKTTRGLIDKISRQRFEIYVIRISPSNTDDVADRICAAADHVVSLESSIWRAREQIAALELDVLFYQDIGMEPTSYLLAFARLAPVQCVSFGHPNTTGIPAMDYFVSNDLYEGPDAQQHYSEKLFLLHDLPTLAYYYKPRAPDAPVDRAEFGLPADANLYLCLQTLYKFHPDFDALLRGILERDPHALIVMINGGDYWTNRLRARFDASMQGLDRRIMFIRKLDHQRFMRLLSIGSVCLDTIHFNGMNSSLESLAVGTPVVTLPTAFQRGRHTQAMWRKMGIFDFIADTPEHYVEIAVRLALDREYARGTRARILAANHVLFEDRRVIAEFERFFATALLEKTGRAAAESRPDWFDCATPSGTM